MTHAGAYASNIKLCNKLVIQSSIHANAVVCLLQDLTRSVWEAVI
jgi:hypothetical protein